MEVSGVVTIPLKTAKSPVLDLHYRNTPPLCVAFSHNLLPAFIVRPQSPTQQSLSCLVPLPLARARRAIASTSIWGEHPIANSKVSHYNVSHNPK